MGAVLHNSGPNPSLETGFLLLGKIKVPDRPPDRPSARTPAPPCDYATDVVIVGAGPVGLFAVFECGMLGMGCHVIDSLADIGGQCRALYPEKPIYDIPGYPRIDAGELVDRLAQQAAPFAPVYHLNQQVVGYDRAGDWHVVTTSAGTRIAARAVIIAAGAGAFGPNRPPLAGIDSYERSGAVGYLVKKRGDYAGKDIVIAGGGDSAVDWALSLSDVARKIYFVHRRDALRASPDNVARLRADTKIELVIPYQLHALIGDGETLAAVDVADLTGATRRLDAQHLLAFFGMVPQLGPLKDWALGITLHHIPVAPSTCATQLDGVFAIGDVADYPGKLKLILTGFAEAASAAHAIHPLVFAGEALHFEYSTSKGLP